LDKLKVDKVILKALNLSNKIELIKDGWRYIKPEDVPKYKARGYIVERGPRGGWRVKVSDSGRPVKEGKKPSGITFDRSIQNFIRSAELFGVKDKLVNELKDFMSDNEDKSNEAYFRIRQMLRDMKREGHIDSKQYNRLANGIRDAYKRKFGELPAKKKLKEAKEKIKPKEEKKPKKKIDWSDWGKYDRGDSYDKVYSEFINFVEDLLKEDAESYTLEGDKFTCRVFEVGGKEFRVVKSRTSQGWTDYWIESEDMHDEDLPFSHIIIARIGHPLGWRGGGGGALYWRGYPELFRKIKELYYQKGESKELKLDSWQKEEEEIKRLKDSVKWPGDPITYDRYVQEKVYKYYEEKYPGKGEFKSLEDFKSAIKQSSDRFRKIHNRYWTGEFDTTFTIVQVGNRKFGVFYNDGKYRGDRYIELFVANENGQKVYSIKMINNKVDEKGSNNLASYIVRKILDGEAKVLKNEMNRVNPKSGGIYAVV